MESKASLKTQKVRVLKTGVAKHVRMATSTAVVAKDLGSRLAVLEASMNSRLVSLNGRLVAAERAYHALDANHVRLVGHLDIYAGQLAANEAKVTERLGAMEAAHRSELQAQDAALKTKLNTVESLFVATCAHRRQLSQALSRRPLRSYARAWTRWQQTS